VLLTKTDLLAAIDDFSTERAERCVRTLANPAPVLRISARKGLGMDKWLDWLRGEVKQLQVSSSRFQVHTPERAPRLPAAHATGGPRNLKLET
jgi:hydrogenase nickel incorporation protein HypB